MTLTDRIQTAFHLWQTTHDDRYLQEYLALGDVRYAFESRQAKNLEQAKAYLKALHEGSSIVLHGEGL